MPLYEIDDAGELLPFRRLRGGAELYEREIEDLAWANPEEVVGETLFLIQRQPTLPSGGRPDIVALDGDARVVVIEVKREFDRGQLAQCLEYAGWARQTNLDELALMYRFGAEILDAGLLRDGDALYWDRPNLGHRYEATVTSGGRIVLPDGRAFASPSRAAIEAADIPAFDGWYGWRVERVEGRTLDSLRRDLAASSHPIAAG